MDKETRRIKRVMRDQQRRRKLEKDTASVWHSRSYQKEFEGFAEREVQTGKGRAKIERIYVGNYYELDADDQRRWLVKWTHLVFALAAAVFFYFAATASVAANYVKLITFFQALQILTLAWMLWLSVRNLLTPKRMIIRQYRGTSKAIRGWTKVGAAAAGVNGLMSFAVTLIHGKDNFGAGLLCVLWYALTAALMLLSGYIEKEQRYRAIPNNTPITEDMVVIGNIEV